MLIILNSFGFVTMAEKRQSCLLVWLKDVPSPKTAWVSDMRENETGNEEYEKEYSVDELDDYFASGKSINEANEAELTKAFKMLTQTLRLDL